MTNQFVTVASCANELEASNIVAFLAANGVEAHVESGAVNTTLNYGPALGDVKVVAATVDQQMASKLMQALRQDKEQHKDQSDGWECPNCHQSVQGDFDVCWNCSAVRPDEPELLKD